MWRYLPHYHPSGEAKVDYVLAGSLISAPAWSQFISASTPTLAWLGVVLGVLLGLIRLWKELRGPKPKS